MKHAVERPAISGKQIEKYCNVIIVWQILPGLQVIHKFSPYCEYTPALNPLVS